MSSIKITTSQNIELEYDLASLGERILGTLIDILIITAYFFIALMLLGFSIPGKSEWMIIMLYIPAVLYHLVCEVIMNGQSVGKRVMNMKVISLSGVQPSLGQYLIRWLFRLVDCMATGYIAGVITVAFSERNQRLGDMVAGTTVIKTIPRTTIQQTIYTPIQQPDYKVTFPEVTGLNDHDMQLIQEVILSVNNSGNQWIARQAADKIMESLQIQSSLQPLTFLKVLLSDYNYLTAQ